MDRAIYSAIFYLLLVTTFHAQESYLFNTSADLDGDGKPETIALIKGSNYNYTLHINNLKQEVAFGREGFLIYDIDTTDAFKEIAVFTSGPSDDYEYEIFRYKDNKLYHLGLLEGEITVNGDGTLFTDNGEGFWFKRDVYFLNNELNFLGKHPFKTDYYVGFEVTVTKPFQIFNDLLLLEPFIEVKPQTPLKIQSAHLVENENGRYIYQVVTHNGLLGYTNLDTLLYHTEGIIMSD